MQHALADSSVRLEDVPFLLRNRLDDLSTERTVFFHHVVFVNTQFARLEQNRIWNSDLADVVQLSRLLQHFKSVFRITHLPGND